MKIYLRLLRYVYPYRWSLVLAAVFMLLVAGLTSLSAYVVKPVMDRIFVQKKEDLIIPFAILIVLIFFFKGLFAYLQRVIMGRIGMRVVTDLRQELFEHLLTQNLAFFSSESSGNLLSRIVNDVYMVQFAVTQAFTGLIQHAFTVIGLIGVVFYLNYKLAAIAVIAFPLAVYPLIYFSQKMRKYSRETQKSYSRMSEAILEGIKGIQIVKAFNTEEYEKKRFREENERMFHVVLKNVEVQALSSPVMEFIGALGIAAIISLGGYLVIRGHMTEGAFFSFLASLMMLYDPIRKMNGLNSLIQAGVAAGERIFYILDLPPTDVDREGAKELKSFERDIRYNDVYFRYEERWVIKGVSMEIGKGEMVAIVGSTGSGKTTLVNLLPRFYEVTKGSITIDDEDIRNFTLSSLRRHISIVTQQTILFNDTVKNNILYGNWDATFEDVVKAAKVANAHDFIMKLPNGYDTVIGEGGVRLSGGERQRISIARAILKNAPILILDEATSSLDTEAEKEVQEAIERLMSNRTSIVIAHRLSTVRRADRIYVIKDGKVVEVGTHEELLEKQGEYFRLYMLQFEDQENVEEIKENNKN